MKMFEPLSGSHEDELLAHLAADAQLVPYQPGMVLPVQVAPAPDAVTAGVTAGFTDGSSSGRRAPPPARDRARR
ncbi:MAG: hypothetical protein R3233_01120 [Xanthomonadales bacterium]|nr:hypothetical protein [Xanthomonadales bacterium]